MDHRRTTRCCSAVALTLAVSASVSAQPLTPKPYPTPRPATVKVVKSGPLPLTPSETVWAMALNLTFTVPPAYDDRRAFFSIGGDRLVAYDLISGKQEWLIDAKPLQEPAAGDGLVFFLEANVLKAVQAADGSLAWWIPFDAALAARPVWDNGWLVVATTSGDVRAFRATDGQLIWHRDLASPAHAAPALAADRVYIPTTDSRIVALNVATGEPVWERRLGGAADEVLARNDRIFAGSRDNFFYCVMAKDGRIDWRVRTGGDVIGKAVADDRYVYFVSLDNVLRAMNMVSGGQQWIRPLPMRPAWGPTKAGATILVAGQSAPLRAYGAKDGVAAGTVTGMSTKPQEAPAAEEPAAADTPAEPSEPPALPNLVPLAADALVAAGPHVLEHPVTHMPLVVLSFNEIAKGTSATLIVHSFEPTLIPAVAALPNLVQIAPVAPTTPPPRP